METISNSILTVQVAEHGAELQSIKKGSKEYLWQGDAQFWDAVRLYYSLPWAVYGRINTGTKGIYMR